MLTDLYLDQCAEFSTWPLSSRPESIRVKHSSYFFTESFLALPEPFNSFERSQGEKTYEKTGPTEYWIPAGWTAFICVNFCSIDLFCKCQFCTSTLRYANLEEIRRVTHDYFFKVRSPPLTLVGGRLGPFIQWQWNWGPTLSGNLNHWTLTALGDLFCFVFFSEASRLVWITDIHF